MNRLQNLFGRKQNNILSVYFTAGHPTVDSVADIITALDRGGIDMIEVGVPFSDPMADGPTIQNSSTIALRNGMTLERLLNDIVKARESAPDIPLVLMGYLNPFMHFGIRRLFERCKQVGIDAMIVPDLPFDDYISDFRSLCQEFDIPMIMLITPETSADRIHLIDDNCDGFIYMVSAASTTGARSEFGEKEKAYFKRIAAMELRHQRLIGFGISNKATLGDACSHAAGAIIGSKFIKCLEATDTPTQAVAALLQALS